MSSKFSKSFGGTSNAAIHITMYAHAMVEQKDITISELPNLPQHQDTARAHAENWFQTILPEIKAVSQDIVSYAQIFGTAYKELEGLVDRLKKGDQKAKDHFKLLLTDVLLVGYKKADISRIAASTSDFKQSLKADIANFITDSEDAKSAYTKENKDLEKTQKEEEAAHSEVIDATAELLIETAKLEATIALLALVTIFSFGAGDGELALEVMLDAAEVVVSTIRYELAVKKDYNLQLKIKQEKEELAKLNVVQNQLKGFSEKTFAATNTAQAVVDGWSELGDDLLDLIQKLDEISPQEAATVIETQLSAAQAEWKVVLAWAKVLEPAGQIPMKRCDMQTFLNDIKPKP